MKENNILAFEQPADFYYKRAQRLMDDGNYINALPVMRKALEKSPGDYEFSLCLAEILTELGKYEESNRVLFEAMEQQENVDADCFFCLGCNFMGLNDIDKARESFERYLQVDPDGEYRDEVEDFLLYFDAEAGDMQELMEEMDDDEAYAKANEGKRLLDNAEYDAAIEVLESIEESDDEMAYARNNLALAHYCKKEVDRAIEITSEVLAKNKNNIHANCNMAVFLYDKGRKAESDIFIEKAMQLAPAALEDIYKLAISLCELKRHEDAVIRLRSLADMTPYDEKVLFYLSAALFNTKKFKEALSLLADVKKLDYPGVIADYYIKMVNRVILNPEDFEEIGYVYQVPAEAARAKIKYLNDCLKLKDSEFSAKWKEDEEFLHTTLWGLEYGDDNIKRAIAGMIAGFADAKAEKILRTFIMKKNQPDDVKNDIFILLKRMNAKEPYVAYIGDEVVEVKVGTYGIDGKDLSEDYTKLFRILSDIIEQTYPESVMKNTLNVIQKYIDDGASEEMLEHIKELAAAILYLALVHSGVDEDLGDVSRRFGADEQVAAGFVEKLKQIPEKSDVEQ
ncbi:tetratricopeptide repeat protein [Christensenellaceae bacterium OttesenSCG-928-K19]|nr:tetratricopeptide repeat protein [Christensenellaceae bacterium OttesenSCG-928-K19]